MSLLHQINHAEIPQETELEGVPPEHAITALRGVETYGPEVAHVIARSRKLADKHLHEAVQAAQQVERTAVDASFTPVVFAEEDIAEALDRATKQHAALSDRQDVMVDSYNYRHNFSHGYRVGEAQLAFMARCLLKGSQEEADEYASQSYKDALDWMRENPQTSQVLETIEVEKSFKAQHLGKKVLQFFSHRPSHSRVTVAH